MKTSFKKTYYATAVLLISTIAGVFDATAAPAPWPTTKATRCWSITDNSSTPEERMFLQARIIPMGSGFYTMNDVIVANGSIHNIGSGTAYVRGNSVYITTSDAGKDSSAMWAGLTYTVLDRNTLIGKHEGVGHDINYADSTIDTEYSSGTLTPVSCTSIWQ
jgi:hypothetical protein